jgi:hypothetical protein
MPEMQKEIYCNSQLQRTRWWKGQMPEMWWEKTGTTHYGFPGENLQKKLSQILSDIEKQGHCPLLLPVSLFFRFRM